KTPKGKKLLEFFRLFSVLIHFSSLCLLNFFQTLLPFGRSLRLIFILLNLSVNFLFVDDVFLNNELLYNTDHIRKEIVESKTSSHFIKYPNQQEGENIGHPF